MRIKGIILSALIFVISLPTFGYEYYAYPSECPADKPIKSGETGECFSCDYTGAFVSQYINPFTKVIYKGCQPKKLAKKTTNEKEEEVKIHACIDEGEEVDICNNRESFNISVFHGDIGTIETVNLLKECPKDKPLKTVEGCFSCDDLRALRVLTIEDCEICSNRYSSNPIGDIESGIYCPLKQCPKNTFRRDDSWGSCVSCDETAAISIKEKDDCDVCSNREFIPWCEKIGDTMTCFGRGDRCALKECPKGYWKIGDGSCLKCSEEHSYKTTKEECDKCPIREFKKTDDLFQVVDAETGEKRNSQSEVCFLKECPNSAPVRWKDGSCHPCIGIGGGWVTTELKCQLCPDTEYQNGKCLNKCHDDEFRGEDGWCRHCQYYEGTEASSEECNKCSERVFVNGFCILKDSPLLIEYKHDFSCSYTEAVATNLERCSKCPNRKYVNGECILK